MQNTIEEIHKQEQPKVGKEGEENFKEELDLRAAR